MYLAYTPEQEALRRELRAYYDELLTRDVREALLEGHGTGETTRRIVRRMGRDAKQLELGLGGATRQLLSIGQSLADEPA